MIFMGYVGLPEGTKNQFHGKQLEIQSGLEKSMFMDMTVETRNVCELPELRKATEASCSFCRPSE